MKKREDDTKVKMNIQDQKQSKSLTNDLKFTKVNKVGEWIKPKTQGKRIEPFEYFVTSFYSIHLILYMLTVTGRKRARQYRCYGQRTAIWFCSSHDDDHKDNISQKCTNCPICKICHDEIKKGFITPNRNLRRNGCHNTTLLNNQMGMKPLYSSKDNGERYECRKCKNFILFDMKC